MYQLIIYNDDKVIKEVIEVDKDIKVNGSNVRWGHGQIDNIKLNFIVIDSDQEFETGNTIGDETISQDLKDIEEYKKVDLVKENKALKKQIANLEAGKRNIDMTLIDLFEQIQGVK